MMNQVASQTEIGKICSKQSPCSASRLSRPADTPSSALSHGQDLHRQVRDRAPARLVDVDRALELWAVGAEAFGVRGLHGGRGQELRRHLRRRDPRCENAAWTSQGGTRGRLSLPSQPQPHVGAPVPGCKCSGTSPATPSPVVLHRSMARTPARLVCVAAPKSACVRARLAASGSTCRGATMASARKAMMLLRARRQSGCH